ncbi:MAG: hypothetical protein EHM13_03110, partial [Acidobacteria bacterium]
RRSLPRTVVYAAAFLALIELLKAFLAWRYADSANVLVGAVGAAIGAALAASWSGRSVALVDGVEGQSARRTLRALWFALVGWVLVVCFYEWYPFEFDFGRRSVRAAVNSATIVPFLNYLRAPIASAVSDAFAKVLVSFPLGLIVSALASRSWPHAARAVVLLASGAATAALFFVLESGQVFLPARVPDATDVVLPVASALVAAWLVTGLPLKPGGRSIR